MGCDPWQIPGCAGHGISIFIGLLHPVLVRCLSQLHALPATHVTTHALPATHVATHALPDPATHNITGAGWRVLLDLPVRECCLRAVSDGLSLQRLPQLLWLRP